MAKVSNLKTKDQLALLFEELRLLREECKSLREAYATRCSNRRANILDQQIKRLRGELEYEVRRTRPTPKSDGYSLGIAHALSREAVKESHQYPDLPEGKSPKASDVLYKRSVWQPLMDWWNRHQGV